MDFTEDQERAINTRGGKILVSAAAGSGKTAVLSERVLRFVLNGGDINKLLVVTFTSAAALEMKGRIKEKIEQSISKNKDNKHLIKQLTLIDDAKITTMDSFYSEIVKQNFEKLGIMPDFNILSSVEEKLLKNKVINEIFNDNINDIDFINLLHVFNANSNDLIKDKVFLISSFLDTEGFYKEYIEKTVNKYETNYYKELLINEIKNKFNSFKESYKEIKEELYNASSDFDKLSININEEESIINKILNINSFNELSDILRLTSFSKQAIIRGHNDDYIFNKYKFIRKKLKDEITIKLNDLKYITDEIYDKEKNIIKNALVKLFYIVQDFRTNLLEEKKKINKFSFSDIPLFVIDLLVKDGKKTSLAYEYSKLFDEILIDEYQDTNKLQSIIFNAISKDNSNLFVVGDIKQSIYRFRSACPDIFNSDKNNSFKDKFPMLITLSQNFRSRNLVLDFSNYIFESIMSENLGEVCYNDDEKLYTGATFLDNLSNIAEVDIINLEEKDEDDELTKVEKEAIHVAKRIKELLDNKHQVYERKGYFRDIKESDIAILLRKLTYSEIYKKALEKNGINVYLDKDLVYFDNLDVKLIISLLKVLDNFYDDVSLMTVLMSNLFNVKEEDLIKLRINNKYDLIYDLIKKGNNIDLKEIINLLEDLSLYAKENNLVDTLNYIYKKLDIIEKIGTDKNKIKNLTLMIKNASDFSSNENKTLHEFISYIDDILNDKSSFSGQAPLSDGSNVTITTIHKSKGLEYPVVFVSDCGSKFNKSDYTQSFLIDSNYGISFEIFDYEKKCFYETISNRVLKNKIKNLALSEELRVLYVALTRAKEKLIITGTVNNLSKLVLESSYELGNNISIDSSYLESCDTYIKWIISCLIRKNTKNELNSMYELNNKKFDYNCDFKVNVINANDIKDINLDDNLNIEENTKEECIKDYDSSYIDAPLYLSVSDIKMKEHKFIRKPYFLKSDTKNTNIGTLYHKIYEVLPIKKYSISSLKEELENIKNNGIITSEELKLIDIEKIFCFLTSDIYEYMLNANEIYREKELTFKVPMSYYKKDMKGEFLTSGIIDLLFIYDDTYFIVDYKTDDVNTLDELKERYEVQLELYEIGIKNIINAKNIKKYIYSVKLNKFIEI